MRPAARAYRERADMMALVEWIGYEGKRLHPELAWLVHLPNGIYTTPALAGLLKAMGGQAGLPDWLLPVARRGYHGLFLEAKSPTGSVTSPQRAWHAWLMSQQYCVRIVRSLDEARETLVWYVQEEARRE